MKKDVQRMVVLVCFDCHKLIGTREDFFIERRRMLKGPMVGKFVYANVCEACHDK
jgi:hypothetical protein